MLIIIFYGKKIKKNHHTQKKRKGHLTDSMLFIMNKTNNIMYVPSVSLEGDSGCLVLPHVALANSSSVAHKLYNYVINGYVLAGEHEKKEHQSPNRCNTTELGQ